MAEGQGFTPRLARNQNDATSLLVDGAQAGPEALARCLKQLGTVYIADLIAACFIVTLRDEEDPAGDLLHSAIHALGDEGNCIFCTGFAAPKAPGVRSTWV